MFFEQEVALPHHIPALVASGITRRSFMKRWLPIAYVVGLAGIVDGEIFAIDGELGFHSNAGVGDFNFRGERNAVGNAVQGEIAGNIVGAALAWRNPGNGESGCGKLLGIEEVRSLGENPDDA